MVKRGFSLAEALVVMVIISIFFAAAAKVITTKPKPKKQVNTHGYFECYRKDGGGLFQRYVREGVPTEEESVSICTFEAPTGVGFFNLNSYSPVAHSSMEPNINTRLTINVGSNITVNSSNGTYTLTGTDGVTQETQRKFFGSIYRDSMVFNEGGNVRAGVIISW